MKYCFISIVLLGFVVSSVVEAQYYISWADTIDNGAFDWANDVAVDGLDNIIVTGASNAGGNSDDYFTVKYNPSGVIQWTDTIDNGSTDLAHGVAVDGSDNIIVTGESYIGGNYDYFTVKYDPSGVILWADTIDNGSTDRAWDVAVDDSDNIIVTGFSYIGGSSDYFTVKYNPCGVIQWIDTIDNSIFDWAKRCAVDGSDNIIVTGLSIIGYDEDYFTVKYSPSGVVQWADTIDNGSTDRAWGVTVDGSDNIIVTGESYIEGNCYDYFTVKYSPSGVVQWVDTIDNGNFDRAYGVAVDGSDNIIVTGLSLIGGDEDYFTVKYAPSIGIEDAEPGFMTSLCEIYPNPLTSDANIRFTTSKKTGVKLGVYDVSGRLIQTIIDNVVDAGEYNVLWDSSLRPSGVYFLKFDAGEYTTTKKLLKVK